MYLPDNKSKKYLAANAVRDTFVRHFIAIVIRIIG